jgi:predicted ATPase
LRGYFAKAKAAEREALNYASEFNHPQTTANMVAHKLLRQEIQRDYSDVYETIATLLDHSKTHNIVFWSLWANIFSGMAKAREGADSDGPRMIDDSLKAFIEMKFTYYRPFHLGMKARAQQLLGDTDAAFSSVQEAIDFAHKSGEKGFLSDLLRLLADLQLAHRTEAGLVKAEEHLLEALAMARTQASKLHELRAAISLARLWRDRGRPGDGERLVDSIYSWFTEGFGAPDLLEAKYALDECRTRTSG